MKKTIVLIEIAVFALGVFLVAMAAIRIAKHYDSHPIDVESFTAHEIHPDTPSLGI